MVIDDVLQRNRSFARGREPSPLPEHDRVALAVVACHDPRLDGLLREALGLEPRTVVLHRTAGAHVSRGGDLLRSLALATFRYGLTEVLVVGHSSCRMAAFRTAEFVDAFRARGVPRDAFGPDDLRTWVGAVPDAKRGVIDSVAAIREAAFLPKDLEVTGAVLDDRTGVLEIVARPGQPLPGFETHATPEASVHEGADLTGDAIDAAVQLVSKLKGAARLREEATRLGVELRGKESPDDQLGLVVTFLRRAGGDAREVRAALREIRNRVSNSSPAAVALEVARRLLDRATED